MIASAMSRRSLRAAGGRLSGGRRKAEFSLLQGLLSTSTIRARRIDAVGFRGRFLPNATADSFIVIVRCKDRLSIFLCSSPDRRPTDFGPRSLPDATAPKGSEDKGYNVRNQRFPTQCPASAWMDSFDNIFRLPWTLFSNRKESQSRPLPMPSVHAFDALCPMNVRFGKRCMTRPSLLSTLMWTLAVTPSCHSTLTTSIGKIKEIDEEERTAVRYRRQHSNFNVMNASAGRQPTCPHPQLQLDALDNATTAAQMSQREDAEY
ncbi:hypothetical protein THAOC_26977 [Thalassiosira oceanica]|uniref:Uncharacterized protein n=1 Tax=Thalassiosira oceanica TaxID=159749 RepID=K0S3T7_THAOC|nr:hypothetical protein THAOC_26977 [Thalassiosira oceanica]|eukprot:EJK53562.1 hypothetical protein THAOC_26977 [Thalassiosira oceanica]